MEAAFSKEDVRDLSHQLGLRTWDKPAMACLSSRFPYGSPLTREKLGRVEGAEDLLRSQLGFRQVRVRDHASIARIEIQPSEFARMLDDSVLNRVVDGLKELGYDYVTLDLQGFRSGSMNEPLLKQANTRDERVLKK
ncbi:MAG: hypothetical protein A2Y73_01340 [Chloroflexi bacterium RBG_13_56_8]|nr:MAG: hypothetical protein A2Y73_01340 [Chloroflexi bacterium RBG_13_56_8]